MKELCGCGRPVRYVTHDNSDGGSCNKYGMCPTYGELGDTLEIANRRLVLFQAAVNKVDDYFEYRMDSIQDQKEVHKILGNLSDALKNHTDITTPSGTRKPRWRLVKI